MRTFVTATASAIAATHVAATAAGTTTGGMTAAMTAGAFVVYTWSVAGNQLTVSPLRTQNGPVANPPTIKLVKVE